MTMSVPARRARRRASARIRAPRPSVTSPPRADAPIPAVWVGDVRQAAQIIAQAPDDAALQRLALWTAPDAPPEACIWIAAPAAAAAALAPFGARCALRLASLDEARRLGLDAVLAARFPGGVGLPLTLRRATAARHDDDGGAARPDPRTDRAGAPP